MSGFRTIPEATEFIVAWRDRETGVQHKAVVPTVEEARAMARMRKAAGHGDVRWKGDTWRNWRRPR